MKGNSRKSNLRDVEIGVCPICDAAVCFSNAMGYHSLADGKLFAIKCSACGGRSKLKVTNEQLDAIRRSLQDGETVEEPAVSRLSDEMIGRIVHGFRIDLDVVESVADLLDDWAYMDKYKWTKVPRETDKYAPLPQVGGYSW